VNSMSTGKVAKKLTLYPPKRVMRELGLKEGQLVRYRAEEGRLVIEPLLDPIELALSARKWSKTSVKEFEEQSENEQADLYG
ncbi:MAG: AbrB/MazE/SpoVT family DNA-binding domain-containing protein, partial [Nitrososphaerota archaeon]|nr:AbrB/MazE/SpoVT family DNA-binding domain-containing protein [Nitrososphaerota archaeon]